jgi:hypothetical protein
MSWPRFATALLALVALGSPAEEIAFRVAAGTTLARTLKNEYSMQLESVTLTMDGEEVPAEALGEFDIRIEHSESYAVTDGFEAVAAGRPQRLRRTFEDLRGRQSSSYSSEEGEQDGAGDYESPLEGKTVVFSWNDESKRFDAAFAEGVEGDEALLADLDEDMDLRRLLPAGSVSEGESWEVDPHAFAAVLDPGGDLGLEDGRAKGGSPDRSVKEAQFRANLSGTITATFQGTRTEDGIRQAVIALVCNTSTHAEEEIAGDEIPEGASGTERVEVRFKLEGQLRWDLEHGHALSFELSGENGYTSVQTIRDELDGESFVHSQTMVFSGESSFSMQVERR